MGITYPSDFDKHDRKMAGAIAPDDTFVTDMLVIVTWMNADGSQDWAVYNSTADNLLSSKLGLLDLAKAELIARCKVEADDE